MDFNDSPQEAAFRAEARAWLEDNAERKGPGKVYRYKRGEPELIPAARAWEERKFEGGFSGIALPQEFGGRGETRLQQIIFAEEEADYLIPPAVFSISHGMAVPTLLTYANERQKQRYVPATLRGDEIWCQMFSEPAGGSDLAGLRTRSVRDGDAVPDAGRTMLAESDARGCFVFSLELVNSTLLNTLCPVGEWRARALSRDLKI